MYPTTPYPEQGAPQPPQPQPAAKRRPPYWLVGLVAGIIGLCCIGGIFTMVATASGGTDRPSTVAESPTPEPVIEQPAPERQPTPEPEPAPEPEPESELTVSQEQAIGSAESYLAFSGFSRQGLIDQLLFEGFDEADAEFAVDYIEVDWMEQAVRVAESYLEYSSFSRQGLIDQLEYEGFTREQAEHGADEVGL